MSSKDNGFSLIELLISVAIIAILSTIGARFINNVMRDSAYAQKVDEGRTELKQTLNKVQTLANMRDADTGFDFTATSLGMNLPEQGVTPITYYKMVFATKCRQAPITPHHFTIQGSSEASACYNKLACNGQIPYIEVTPTGSATKSVEQWPAQTRFNNSFKSEYDVVGLGFCVDNEPESYAIKGIVAISILEKGKRVLRLEEETLLVPKRKRNGIDIISQ